MIRTAILILFVLLGACAMPPHRPELAACFARMEAHAASLRPGFAALGYQPEVYLRLDEHLADSRGFRSSKATLGDASPGGSIRLRPSRLCVDDVLARAVVAHEMAHIALRHQGVAGNGITLLWDKPPQQEADANQLAFTVLKRTGGGDPAAMLVGCWLGNCDGVAPPESVPRRGMRMLRK